MKLLSPALALLLFAASGFAAEPVTLKLWPEGAPGQMTIKPADPNQKPNPNVVTNITEPTLTVYQPEKPNGTAVVVAPGGGSASSRSSTRARRSASGSIPSA